MNLAPVIIFTYRRKIELLITSLLKNEFVSESNLYIFSDGYKNDIDKNDVQEVRESLKNIQGFKNISIIESKENKGLAHSVIDGVTSIIHQYDKVIVLEDDLIVADNFLTYMNETLGFFENNNRIWSISGYTPSLECLNDYEQDIYLSVRASSWGWATWNDRWNKIDWDIKDWNSFKNDKKAIEVFNLGGNDMYSMLKMQMLKKIDSWAIRWCYNQFQINCYTVYPAQSKVINIGFDEKGTHNTEGAARWKTKLTSEKVRLETIVPGEEIIKCFKKKYDLKLKTKIGYFLKEQGGYNVAKKLLKKLN